MPIPNPYHGNTKQPTITSAITRYNTYLGMVVCSKLVELFKRHDLLISDLRACIRACVWACVRTSVRADVWTCERVYWCIGV